jgi:polysaccharide export outer membrane protein
MKRTVFKSLVFVLCLASVIVTNGQVAPPAGSGSARPTTTPQQPTPSAPQVTASYIIQPNDVLSVFVYKYPELSRDRVLVLPDGTISLPLIQSMKATGMTSAQLKQNLEAQLKEFVNVPNVTVSMESLSSYQVYVMGKVGGGGEKSRSTPINVMQAIAASGGFGGFADTSHVVIFRGDQRIRFNFDDFEKGRNQDKNIELLSGDVVYVP